MIAKSCMAILVHCNCRLAAPVQTSQTLCYGINLLMLLAMLRLVLALLAPLLPLLLPLLQPVQLLLVLLWWVFMSFTPVVLFTSTFIDDV